MTQQEPVSTDLKLQAEAFLKIHPLEFYRKFLPENVRPDGRKLNAIRNTLISKGTLQNTQGSSIVKIGNTNCICGIKAQVMIPSSEQPNLGKIVTNIELPVLCSPMYQSNYRLRDAQQAALTSIIHSTLENVIDLSQLCIEEGKAVWVLYVDLYCLCNDGNVLDCALLAIVSALENVVLPGVEITEEVLYSEKISPKKLELKYYPIPLTFGVLDSHILLDPTDEEESLLSTKFTIIYNEKGQLCSIHKSGGTIIKDEILKECMQRAKERVKELIHFIKS